MATRIGDTRLAVPSSDVALRIVGKRDTAFIPRVQRFSLQKNIPVNDVDELGNPHHAGIVKDPADVTLNFSVFDTGVKLFSAMVGVDANNYPTTGAEAKDISEIDAIIYIKDEDNADYVKSIHAQRLQVRDFTYTFSVDGESEESYTAVGSQKRVFSTDVVVDKFTSGTNSFTLSETALQLKNGKWLLSVILDGKYLSETTGTPGSGEYSFDSSTNTITTGDNMVNQLLAVYQANPAGNNWSDISDTTMPAAIKGGDVEIEIAANGIARVQSVTINGKLNVKPVREMGSRAVIGYQRQVPSVDGRIRVLDTDNELIKLLATGSTSTTDTEFSLGEGCSSTALSLEIKLKDPCDTTASGTVLKTYYLPSIEIVGDTHTYNVNDNGVVEFNWRSTDASVIIYSGARQ